MNPRTTSTPADRLLRALGFWLFSTTGMAAIGLALIAGPLASHFKDQDTLHTKQQRLQALEHLKTQRNQLIARADNPSVIERAAIDQLNYLPPATLQRSPGPLPATWPALEKALKNLDQKQTPQPAAPTPKSHQAILKLATQKTTKLALATLGAALVLVSLTCFNRPTHAQ